MQISFAGYGDKEGIYPNVNERVLHVLTNMARMAPQSFDDKYLLNGILDSYTARHPLYLDQTLSKLARYHSEDMAHNGYGFHKEASGHYSSKLQSPPDTTFNGDVVQSIDSLISFGERVKGMNDSNFNYTESGSTSENVAFIYSTSGNVPVRYINNWLNSTGHRENIFKSTRYEMGNGFVPNDTVMYWSGDTWTIKTFTFDKAGLSTQVLDGGTELDVGPIFAGVGADSIHSLISNVGGNESWSSAENSTTSYLANYYDPGNNPISADVIIEGVRYAMALEMGTQDAGTYLYSETTGACKNFYFEFTDANNTSWTYPETTYLGTSIDCDIAEVRGNSYDIASSAESGGNISPLGTTSVSEGSNQSYTISVDSGFLLDSFLVDGAKVDSTVSYTFKNVTTTHTIDAFFSVNENAGICSAPIEDPSSNSTHPISEDGICFKFSDGGASKGRMLSFINPNTYNNTISWHGRPSEGGTGPCDDLIENLNGNGNQINNLVASISSDGFIYVTVTSETDGESIKLTSNQNWNNGTACNPLPEAPANISTYSLTAIASAGGSISPNGTTVVNENSNQSYSILADAGYQLDSLLVDGALSDLSTSYTFEDITSDHSIDAYFSLLKEEIVLTLNLADDIGLNLLNVGNIYEGDDLYFEIENPMFLSLNDIVVNGLSYGVVDTLKIANSPSIVDIEISIDEVTLSGSAQIGIDIKYERGRLQLINSGIIEGKIEIYDLHGRLMHSEKTFSNERQSIEFHGVDLIYFYKLTTASKSIVGSIQNTGAQ